MTGTGRAGELLTRLSSFRQYQRGGRRAPHKPLLMLLALGRMATDGTSRLPWSRAEEELGRLIAEFGPASSTGTAQSAAYPFTHLRTDGVWVLSADVPMDRLGPLRDGAVVGSLEPGLEEALRDQPHLVRAAARSLAESNFPPTVAADVLEAVGFDPDAVLTGGAPAEPDARRRRSGWRAEILRAWDRQCAFCGYDGQLAGVPVGLEAAHVRWFGFGGPDHADNGLALCMLHHKLFDRGVLGLTEALRIEVSDAFSARTDAGRRLYDLHGRALAPRPGTDPPATAHVRWHRRQVFRGRPLAA